MKRRNLETLVLVLGIAIIGVALFLMFLRNATPQSIFITNLIFSVGFLIYILYSIMTTGTLNREIRGLNSQIKSLKQELENRNKVISEKDERIRALDEDKQNIQVKLSEAQENITQLQNQINTLSSASKSPET